MQLIVTDDSFLNYNNALIAIAGTIGVGVMVLGLLVLIVLAYREVFRK